jgi:hypothetical protein
MIRVLLVGNQTLVRHGVDGCGGPRTARPDVRPSPIPGNLTSLETEVRAAPVQHRRRRARLFRRAHLVCLLVSLVGVSAAASGCRADIEQGQVKAPKRPAGVPKYAVWAGGADGGVFLMVRPMGRDTPDAYSVDIYDDHSGARTHRGTLHLEPAKSRPFRVGEAASYSRWDGETLHLRDGRRLVKSPGE